MADKVRIGAVSYLNTRPLVYGIERGAGADLVRLSYDVPSGLAREMAAGRLDVALLPVIELARMPELELVPGLSISTRGPARSVLLVSRRPPAEVARVALDPDSRTSNAMVQVLFRDVWQSRPSFETAAIDLDAALARCDAAVRIGDKALLETPPRDCRVHDLGRIWTEHRGLPFVYAAWAARPGVVDRELYRILHESRRRGVQAVDRIAADWEWNGRRDPDLARRYLRENIRFRFGAAELEGLRGFLRAAAELGLIERAPEIRFALQRWTTCHETLARAPERASRNLR